MMEKYLKPQISFTNEISKTLKATKVLQNKYQVQHMISNIYKWWEITPNRNQPLQIKIKIVKSHSNCEK
jgi:hypothetical protein